MLETAEASGSRYAPLWTLMVYSGARVGELTGLRWDDVNLEEGTLNIRRTLASAKGGVPTFHEPKTTRSRRTVTLPADAINALRSQRDRQTFERQAASDTYVNHGLVFATELGAPLDGSGVVHRFKDALKRAGLSDKYRPHDLRHAAATLMLVGGVHPKVASERLGHSTVTITLDLYTHAVKGMEAEAADQIQQAIRMQAARS